MRFPTDDSNSAEPRQDAAPRTDDGATLPLRGLTAARLGADDALPLWQRLPDSRFVIAVGGPGPSSFEGTDPIRATRRAHRVLESLHRALEARPLEATVAGFAPLAVEADDTDPLPVLSSEIQLAAAEHTRETGRIRLYTTGDARAYYLDAVALCRLSFDDAPVPGLTGPSSLWLRTVDVRPASSGLLLVVTHGAHGHFAAPWLFERAVVAAFERSTSWRGFCEQLRFALDRETRSGASFAALPVGARNFTDIREAILGPGGQRLSDLAARQASAGGAAWLSAWLSLYGPIHERWRWSLTAGLARAAQPSTAPRAGARGDAPERVPLPANQPPQASLGAPPATATTSAANSDGQAQPLSPELPAPANLSTPQAPILPDDLEGDAEAPHEAAPAAAQARDERPPNWGGVADALTRLSAEWARANRAASAGVEPSGLRPLLDPQRSRTPEAQGASDAPHAEPPSPPSPMVRLRPPMPALRLLNGGVRRSESAARQLEALADASLAIELDPSRGELPEELPATAFEEDPLLAPFTAPDVDPDVTEANQPEAPSQDDLEEALSDEHAALDAHVSATPPAAETHPDHEDHQLHHEFDGREDSEGHDDQFVFDDAAEADTVPGSDPGDLTPIYVPPERAVDSVETLLANPAFTVPAEVAQLAVPPAKAPTQRPWRRWALGAGAVAALSLGVGVGMWHRANQKAAVQLPGLEAVDSSAVEAVGRSAGAPPGTPAPAAQAAPLAGEAPATRPSETAPGRTRRAPANEAMGVTPLTAELRTPEAATGRAEPRDVETLVTRAQPTVAEAQRPREPAVPAVEAPAAVFAPIAVQAPAAVLAPIAVPAPAVEAQVAKAPPAEAPVPPGRKAVAAGAPQERLAEVTVTSRVYAVVRRGPGARFPRVRILAPGQSAVVVARDSGSHWVRLSSDDAAPLWVSSKRGRLAPTDGGSLDLDALPAE